MHHHKQKILLAWLSVFLIASIGCDSSVKPQAPRIIETSAPQTPAWVVTPPKSDATYVYFVGSAENQSSLQVAKKTAVSDATRQLVDYIGIRVTRKLSYKAVGTEQDNLSTFQQQIQDSVEGKGNAKVSIEVAEVYYEKYNNGQYTLYALIKIPKKWVEAERERQRKLVEQQRITAQKYLSDARSMISQRYYQPAIEALWQGLLISGKAAENEDVYEEIRSQLLSLYQRLSLQLLSQPVYAYTEGGSDRIIVRLQDTEKNAPISGIPLEAISASGNIVATTGSTTGSDGKIIYEVARFGTENPLQVTISFSFSTYSNVIASDPELEEQLQAIKQKNRIELSLKVAPRTKVQPTAVVVLRMPKKRSGGGTYLFDQGANDSLSSQLASKGFNIVEIDMPDADLSNEKRFKEALLAHVRSQYPQVRRLLYVLMSDNLLGNAGNIVGDIVNVNVLNSIYMSEVNLSYSWIDVTANKVEEGKPIQSKGAGLNEEQALQKGIKEAIASLVSFLDEQASKK